MQTAATPNAGLTDQRLVLQFVQRFIGLWGGNPALVTAMGESAGAGSIVHHLIAQENGQLRNPLFNRAILQSAAFQWQWNNSQAGTMENVYNIIKDGTSCRGKPGVSAVACLQGIGSDEITASFKSYMASAEPSGVTNIGPAIDGKVITQLPAMAFWSGKSVRVYPLAC
jgi:carboxylesterase type B